MSAADIIADTWNRHDIVIVEGHEGELLGCDGCDWVGPTEGFNPHLAAAVLRELAAADFVVIKLPTVAYKGPNDTDASAFRDAAARLDGGYSPGGSNTKRAISELLRSAAAAAEAV